MSKDFSYIYKNDLDLFLEGFLGVWELYVSDVDDLLDVFLSLSIDILPFVHLARKQLENLGVVTVGDIFLYVPPVTRILFEIRHSTWLAFQRLVQMYEARKDLIRLDDDFTITGQGSTFEYIIKRAEGVFEECEDREEF